MEPQIPHLDLIKVTPIKTKFQQSASKRYETDISKLHDCSYKLKLLMVFALRGLSKNSFRLATEMDDSGNFDYLILERVTGLNGGKSYQLLLAPDTNETRGAITIQNLLQDSKGDFNLHKYFHFFLQLRENSRFNREEDEMKDLIVFANINFKYGDRLGDLQLCNDIFQSDRTNGGEEKLDEVLQTCLLHFKLEFKGKDFLESHLKDTFIRLPKEFAKRVLQGKELDLDDYHPSPRLLPILQIYEKALFNEVIDDETGMFQEGFLEMHNLSPEASHFRGSLQKEFFRRYRGNETAFKDLMRYKKIKVYNGDKEQNIKTTSAENLAEQLALMICKNADSKVIQISKSEHQTVKNIFNLPGRVFIKTEGKVKINPEFLGERNFPSRIFIFRDYLICELKRQDVELSKLEDYIFEIPDFPDENELKITGSYIEETVKSFLQKFSFAINQPDEGTLDDIIKSELLKNLDVNKTQNAYDRLLLETFDWIKDRGGKYFSPHEICFFFALIKKKMEASIWFEVKNPTFNFVGRAKELSTVIKALQETKKNQSAVVITQSETFGSLGGVGKTELAKQFVFLHSGEYENIIWINAESHAAMANSFHRLAFDELGISEVNADGKTKCLESVMEEVYDILWGKRSIFIFDNAEKMRIEKDADAGIHNYMPKCPLESKHHVLITSQSSQWGDLKQVKLEAFTEKDSLEFIEKSINFSKSSEKVQAKNLVKALCCYPLALQHAISYINTSNDKKINLGQSFTIADYLELFQNASTNLLNFPFQNDSIDLFTRSTSTTWKITLDDIEGKPYGKLAVELSHMISFFAPDDVSVENLTAVLGLTDDSDVLTALRLLKQYSMVEMTGKKVSVHRLVQLITRLRLKMENKEEEILRCMLEAAPKLDAEHVISIWKFSSNYGNLVTTFGYLVSNVIDALFDHFNLKEVLSFGRSSILTLEKHLGDKHPFFLEAKQCLAQVLDRMGDYEEALKEYEGLFLRYEKTLGKDDHKTLKMKHYIANMMYNLGNYYEALEYYKSMHSQVSDSYGEDAPDALSLKQNIANVLCSLGEVTQSLKIYHEVHQKLEISLGEFDINTLNAKLNVAYVLERLGDHYEALNYYEEVHNHLKIILDKEDPLTLKIKHNMASVLDKIGRHEEALSAYEDVHKIYLMKYGERHPDSVNIKCNISNILYKLERNQEALESYESVYQLIKHIYGEYHQKTIHVKFCIAQVLGSAKENEKALECYREVYDHFRNSLGERHPKVLQVKQSIANTLYNLGFHDEALESYQEIYGHIKVDLGEEHPHTISTKQCIANIQEKLGNFEESFSIYRELNKKMRIINGEWNEETLSTELNMASVLLKMGKESESLSCYENVYHKQRAILGENHPSTKATKEDMTIAWRKMTNKLRDHKEQMISMRSQTSGQSISMESYGADFQYSIEGEYNDNDGQNESKNEQNTHNTDFHPNFYSSYTCRLCLKRLTYNCTLQ